MNPNIKPPIVTIIMPVHNGEKYLREAIESILAQTFSNFTFLIIDDGSTDDSVNIINSYDDNRIKLLINEKNIGISKSLNRGIDNSQTKYIARMDQDDISFPNRIEEQINFMEAHPEIGICGTWMMAFNEEKQKVLKKRPVKNNDIRAMLLFNNPMAHPTVMIRKESLDANNLRYNHEFDGLEDYDLWERMSMVTKMENIPKALLLYRLHSTQLSRTSKARQEKFDKIQERQYARLGARKNTPYSLILANSKKHIYNSWSLGKLVYGVYYTNLKSLIKSILK